MARSKALITRAGRAKNGPVTSVTPAGLQLIEELLSEGADPRGVAKGLGVCLTTMNRLRDEDDAVREAWDRGLGELATELAHHLLTAARKGNIVAAIFLTKARLGWIEGKAPEGNGGKPDVAIQINLPEPKDRETYMRLVTGQEETRHDGD